MSAFKRFGPGDQIDNVLVLEPTWNLASGTSGWRGSPEGSSSVSLYGGYNRQPGGVVREYAFQRTIQGTDSFGKLTRSEPITASVNFVWMTDENLNLAQRSNERWGHEHWKTVMRLYDFYSRRDPDYTTASYDNYVLYFQNDSRNVLVLSGNLPQTTGSFTLESWVKPLLTSSITNDFTIQSQNQVFWLGVTGSTGKLALSTSHGVVTSSAGPTWGQWNHVAVSYDSTTLAGVFYVNLVNAGNFTMSPLTASTYTTLHSVGNALSAAGYAEGSWSTGSLRRSFHGFIGESRVWTNSRSYSQISSSFNHRLTGSDLVSAQSVLWLNEGPLGMVDGFAMGSGVLDQAQLTTLSTATRATASYVSYPAHTSSFALEAVFPGSSSNGFGVTSVTFLPNGTPAGTFAINETDPYNMNLSIAVDAFSNPISTLWQLYQFMSSGSAQFIRAAGPPVGDPNELVNGQTWLPLGGGIAESLPYGNLRGFSDRLGPVWYPSDNTSFYVPKTLITGSVSRMLALNVPAGMHGRRIVPNTLRLDCQTYDNQTYGLKRTIVDDGRGGLYLSGSSYKNYPLNYPQSTAESLSVLGVPMIAAWSFDDLTGSLVPTFYPADAASPNLAPHGNPVYRLPGAKVEGTDYAVKVTGTTYFEANSANYGVGTGSDLVVMWVAKVGVTPSSFQDFIQKENTGGWHIWLGPTDMKFVLIDHTSLGATLVSTSGNIIGEPHVGIAVYDRTASKARIAIKGVGSGQSYISPLVNVTQTGSFTDPTATMRVGASNHFGTTNPSAIFSEMLIATGSLVASGVTANIESSLNAMVNIVNSRSGASSGPSLEWNKVGNVFYDEGLITIRDPSILDFAASWPGVSDHPTDLLQLSFRNESRIPVKTLMCRIDRGDLNASLNQTFWTEEEDDARIRNHESGSLYVSTVGIYNSDRELVGVARLAEPLRIRPRDRMNVKLRMDF